MKRFLTELGAFATGFLILNWLLYRLFFYDILYRDYETNDDELKKYSKYIFADSHGWPLTRDNPEGERMLKAAGIYNFSYGSESYFDMYFKLSYLVSHGYQIDTVYLSVDDHMLAPYKVQSNNRNRSIVYSNFASYRRYFPTSHIAYYLRKDVIRFLPLLHGSNGELLRRYLFGHAFSNDDDGFNNTAWGQLGGARQLELSRKRVDQFYSLKQSSKSAERCLKDILSLCKRHKIVLIGVKFPLPLTFRKVREAVRYHTAERLTAGGYVVLDYENLLDSDTYFANQDHINTRGAIVLISRMLTESVESADKGTQAIR